MHTARAAACQGFACGLWCVTRVLAGGVAAAAGCRQLPRHAGSAIPAGPFRWQRAAWLRRPGLSVRPSLFRGVVSERHNGRKRLLTLAAYGEVTLAQARKAGRERAQGCSAGLRPDRGSPAERRNVQTVRDVAKLYLERHAKRFKKNWKDDERQLTYYVLPALGHRAVSEVTRADVARLHASIGDRTASVSPRSSERAAAPGSRGVARMKQTGRFRWCPACSTRRKSGGYCRRTLRILLRASHTVQ